MVPLACLALFDVQRPVRKAHLYARVAPQGLLGLRGQLLSPAQAINVLSLMLVLTTADIDSLPDRQAPATG